MLWLRRVVTIVVAIAVGAYLVQLLDTVIYGALPPVPTDATAPPAPLALVPVILIAAGNALGAGVAGVLAAVLAPDKRKTHVWVVAAIVFVLTVRMAAGPNIPTAIRIQSLIFCAASVAGCVVLGMLTEALLRRRAVQPGVRA